MVKVNVVRVRKRFTRARRRRILPANRFTGEGGQIWVDINMENTFTNVDNIASNWFPIIAGTDFDNDSLTGVVKTVRIKRWFGAMRGFGAFDENLFPYVDYDIGLVLAAQGLPTTSASQLQDLVRDPSSAVGATFRLLQHKRITVCNQAVVLPTTETEYEAVVPKIAEDRWNYDVDNGIHLNTEQALYMVVSQCESELYTNEMSSLFQGYVRAFVQLK